MGAAEDQRVNFRPDQLFQVTADDLSVMVSSSQSSSMSGTSIGHGWLVTRISGSMAWMAVSYARE